MSGGEAIWADAASAPAGTVIFVHGYLDGPAVWGRVIQKLRLPGWRSMTVGLQPVNSSLASSRALLEQYAQQVLDQQSANAASGRDPVVVVGHSMGGQIAELAALRLGETLAGLVLVTPAPLAGYPLPAVVMERFESRAGMTDVTAIKEGKRILAAALDDEALETLASSTAATSRDAALEQLRAWTGGHPAGQRKSDVNAPVLTIATDDTFFTAERLTRDAERFPASSVQRIAGAGHWPQLEQPAVLADAISQFVHSLARP
ncbi:MAG: alpha/beta fold hydrolase [Novosphingobium sp.]